jgi:hypothetical protein
MKIMDISMPVAMDGAVFHSLDALIAVMRVNRTPLTWSVCTVMREAITATYGW